MLKSYVPFTLPFSFIATCERHKINPFEYLRDVLERIVALPGSDAAVIRVKEKRRGLAMTLDSNARYCKVDPRAGARLVVAEACRNLVVSGARPLALTNCLNFGSPERPEVMSIIGSVEGRNVLLVDDEVNTGGSIVGAVQVCREFGAKDVYLAFTHGFFTDVTYERLRQLNVKEIILTDTIYQPEAKRLPNMTVLSVGPLLAEVMERAHEGRSVGELFNE